MNVHDTLICTISIISVPSCVDAAVEQAQEKLTEMKLEGEKETTPQQPVSAVPLVGGTTVQDDSDSDSEPAVDIDDFEEEEDPVS